MSRSTTTADRTARAAHMERSNRRAAKAAARRESWAEVFGTGSHF